MSGFEAGLIGGYALFFLGALTLRSAKALGVYAVLGGAALAVAVGAALSDRSRLTGHGHFEAITDAIQTVFLGLSCLIALLILLWRARVPLERRARRRGLAIVGFLAAPILGIAAGLLLFSPILDFPW